MPGQGLRGLFGFRVPGSWFLVPGSWFLVVSGLVVICFLPDVDFEGGAEGDFAEAPFLRTYHRLPKWGSQLVNLNQLETWAAFCRRKL